MSQHLVSTRAIDAACRCGAAIIRGFDEGIDAKVDARSLNSAEEIQALLANRRTYSLSHGRYLTHRTPGRIRIGLKGTVHAQHICTTYKQPPLIGA